MTGRLNGKRAIVFGAGSVGEGWGNGKASSVLFAREGARVACVDINEDAARETADIIEAAGGTAMALAADVTRLADVERAVGQMVETFGGVDILHNNVGSNTTGGPVATTEAEWDKILDLNLKSAFLTCKMILPLMDAQQSGSIINTSSLAALRITSYKYVSYYASKAGLNHFTRAVAIEYADRGIRANTISPGLMDTPHIYSAMAKHYADPSEMRAQRAALSPMKRMGTAWDVAHAALFLASDDAGYITGIDIPVDGGLQAKV